MKNIDSLLKKRKLTGKELGLMESIKKHMWFFKQVKEETIFSKADTFEYFITNQEEFNTYRAYLRMADIIADKIIYLDSIFSEINIYESKIDVAMMAFSWLDVDTYYLGAFPKVMTEKQYQEEKKAQRERKLNESISLANIVWYLAEEIHDVDGCPEDELIGLWDKEKADIKILAKEFPEVYKKAFYKLKELIKSGKIRIDFPEGKRLTLRNYKLLHDTKVKREVLYNLGLGREYIDNYIVWFDYPQNNVAVIPSSESYTVKTDERGYYNVKHPFFVDKSIVENLMERIVNNLSDSTTRLKFLFKSIFMFIEIIKAYSEVMDFDFYQYIDFREEDLQHDIETINERVKHFLDNYKYLELKINELFELNFSSLGLEEKIKEIHTINIEKLKPSKEAINKMRKHVDVYKGTWNLLFDILRGDNDE